MRRVITWLAPLTTVTALSAWSAGAPAGRPPVPVLRQSLRDILSSGYQLAEPPEAQVRDLIVRLLRALRNLLGELSEAGPLATLPDWGRWLLIGALTVLLGLIVTHIVVSFGGLLTESSRRREHPEADARRVDPRAVLTQAEDAFRRGEAQAAVRLLYLAVLLRLDRLGLLTHDPARTNWENLQALTTAGPDTRDAMARLTREVDACVYGGRRPSEQTWLLARDWAEQLWRAEGAP